MPLGLFSRPVSAYLFSSDSASPSSGPKSSWTDFFFVINSSTPFARSSDGCNEVVPSFIAIFGRRIAIHRRWGAVRSQTGSVLLDVFTSWDPHRLARYSREQLASLTFHCSSVAFFQPRTPGRRRAKSRPGFKEPRMVSSPRPSGLLPALFLRQGTSR